MLAVPNMISRLESLANGQAEIGHNATPNDLERYRAVTQERKVQLTAINSWLDRAGIIPPKAQQERAGDLQLAEMTVGELRRLADTLDGEIAERAKVVSAPDSAPADSQGIEALM